MNDEFDDLLSPILAEAKTAHQERMEHAAAEESVVARWTATIAQHESGRIEAFEIITAASNLYPEITLHEVMALAHWARDYLARFGPITIM